MKKFVFITLICFFFGLNVFAQAKVKVLKYEIPKHSPVAAAVRAKGEFIVSVKINKKGKVFSVESEKVHPLLKTRLEQAAGKWLFSADENQAERVVKIIFEYREKVEDSTDERLKQKVQFIKPFRLIITRIIHPIY